MYADLRCKLDEFFVLFIFLITIMNNLRFLILVKVFYNNKKIYTAYISSLLLDVDPLMDDDATQTCRFKE